MSHIKFIGSRFTYTLDEIAIDFTESLLHHAQLQQTEIYDSDFSRADLTIFLN
jgi:uncharacterized protein YjbI with pentapeptide repeats